MKNILYLILKYLVLFLTGGLFYIAIEIGFRGYSHVSMFIVGALCYIIIGKLNDWFTWEMSLIAQMVISAFIITTIEFMCGLIVNVYLNLHVWDYSSLPYNFMGQICLLFSNLWALLSLFPILLDDWMRYLLFHDQKPHYKLF